MLDRPARFISLRTVFRAVMAVAALGTIPASSYATQKAPVVDRSWPGGWVPPSAASRIQLALDDELRTPHPPAPQPQPQNAVERAHRLMSTLAAGRMLSRMQLAFNWDVNLSNWAQTVGPLLVQRAPEWLMRVGGLEGVQAQADLLAALSEARLATALNLLIAQATVNAAAAVAPSSISFFYMVPYGRPYAPNNPKWAIQIHQHYTLQIFVVPHSSGGPVSSLLNAVMTGLTYTPRQISGKLDLNAVLQSISRNFSGSYGVFARQMGAQHDVALTPFDPTSIAAMQRWAATFNPSLTIPPADHEPVEINNSGIVLVTAGQGPSGQVSVVPSSDGRWVMTGEKVGETSIFGQINPSLRDLWAGGVQSTQRMDIMVLPGPPDAPGPTHLQPTPVGPNGTVSGNLRPMPLPAPVPGPVPSPPAPNPATPYVLCGQDNSGSTSKFSGACEEPK